jgi:uncharacterized protein
MGVAADTVALPARGTAARGWKAPWFVSSTLSPMIVGIVSCELHLPESRSLKDKRRVVKSLVDRIFQRYRVSIAETGFQELHQRAEISIAVVTQREAELNKLMEHIRDLLDSQPEVYLTRWEPQLLEAQP